MNPCGKPDIVILHLSVVEIPIAAPKYAVKLLDTAALDKTYSITRFAPVIKAANSPANQYEMQMLKSKEPFPQKEKKEALD